MRAFIAVQVKPSDYLASVFRRFSEIKGIKVTEYSNIHLTIKFLGDIDDDKASDICSGIRSIGSDSFDLETEGIGAFPSMERPRVIYIGCRSDGLYRLVAEVGKFVPIEKDFIPHITVGRVKHRISMPNIELKSEKYRIDEICLFRSDLKPSGPIYTKICCKQLGKQDSDGPS
ncbi:RNA 2',3'-cyclic phosphodiesterase [Thermoplasma sp.]|uniref:RNA 2',3'-cyclic phosphodiesterase n=1 Tax=Thermoplasma sp. TaxID=1973142 RepID=UPI00128A14B8|nr:RNA 2',3'-cyclic phosphodiesterase [Thermoplasma sp.]KAA8922399.1 MAG: RNA 2',3'-cyclic phosphodiesterase [Thermoplasma sp.]